MVGLEAMACGCLVLGSNKYGPSTYLKNDVNGITFDPENPKELSDKIIKLLNKPDIEKNRLRLNAFKTVDKYDMSRISEVLVNIFENFR